jgi:two-component system cell cycle response regulator DivK
MCLILVVEDNPMSRELLCDWLEVQGYEVASARTLEEAFVAVERAQPDAVLLDVQLGTEDGLSLPGWMRKQSALRHIPVIAVTAHAMMVEQERVLLAGCSASVSKPIEFQLLQDQLEKWLTVGALMRSSSDFYDQAGMSSVSTTLLKGAVRAE